MKFYQILTCIYTLYCGIVQAQSDNKIVQKNKAGLYATFKGEILSDDDSIKLQFAVCNNCITGAGKELNWYSIPLPKKGTFKLVLPLMQPQTRVLIQDAVSGAVFYNYGLLNSGDNIKIKSNIRNDGDSVSLKFSGIGSEKYECAWELKNIKDTRVSREKDLSAKIRLFDSLIEKKAEVLNLYKKQIDTKTYQIIKADIVGQAKHDFLLYAFGDLLYGNGDATNEDKRNAFYSFIKKKDTLSPAIQALSSNYVNYLYSKEKLDLIFLYKGRNFDFQDLYYKLRKEFSGVIRERLLTYCIVNSPERYSFFSGSDADDFKKCVMNAVDLIQTPWLKKPVQEYSKAIVKGAASFNFSLPIDSSDQIFDLKRLRGKVVLLDMWGYQCTGCYLFSKIFHEKIYPQLKNDTNFAVVSIMIGESSKTAYMRRLRREGGTVYTYPDYINLFGGIGSMGKMLIDHYNIAVFPFIALIGKNSNIYTTTPPFFTDINSPNIDKLTSIIKQALNEPIQVYSSNSN